MFGRKKKKSFIEKLTGGIHIDDYEDEFEDDYEDNRNSARHREDSRRIAIEDENEPEHMIQNDLEEPLPEEGQLAVDVINDDEDIIVKTMIAGVKPSDIDVDISRDIVTVRGTRQEEHSTSSSNYHHQELYWGTFSRNILLPEEIDVDLASAKEKHGVLTLRLPKIDKNKKTKLRVNSGH